MAYGLQLDLESSLAKSTKWLTMLKILFLARQKQFCLIDLLTFSSLNFTCQDCRILPSIQGLIFSGFFFSFSRRTLLP
uniref:Uncharacterized protein n=1 Tax=Arundo donax TaxID=35708 RepID=A0A0A9BGW9_ARUDO